MKKILIVTSSVDLTVDYIIERYKGICKFYRVNVDMFNHYTFNYNAEYGFNIKNNYFNICEKEIDSIYYRKPLLPDLSEYDDMYHTMISRDIVAYINGFVDAFDGKVLSKPSVLKKSENKVYQMKIAKKVGFKIPESSIGTELNIINRLIEHKSIIKPLTTGKIVCNGRCEIIQTSLIDKKIDEDISFTPLYIQKYIDKSYELRVTIVENNIFSVKIEAFDKIDWRISQEKNKYSVVDIPETIKKKCFNMLKIMNLNFGAFDFIVNKNNEYIFLEVNPNGQWLWLEEELGIMISQKILNYLRNE